MWNDNNDNYISVNKDTHGRLCVEGVYCDSGTFYQFSGHEQAVDAPVRFRGRVSAIDTINGEILKMRGKQRRNKIKKLEEKGKTMAQIEKSEALNVYAEVTCQSLSIDDIQQAIERKARKLSAKHIDAICDQLRVAAPGDLPVMALGEFHLCQYLSSTKGKLSETTIARQRNGIKEVLSAIGNITSRDLTVDDIQVCYPSPDPNQMRLLRYASNYWKWLLEMGYVVSTKSNPFVAYFDRFGCVKSKKDPEKCIAKAKRAKALPTDVERKINDMISAAPVSDKCALAAIIIKESGASVRQACNLRRRDILITGQQVRLRYQLDGMTGATHLYVIPLSQYASREVIKRLDAMHDISDDDPVIGHNTHIAEYCRQLVHDAYRDTADADIPHAGVNLLKSNYQYRICQICGGIHNPGASAYLSLKSLSGNVSADHYCSYSGEDGQDYLLALISRDHRFDALDDGVTEVGSTWLDNGYCDTTLHAPHATAEDLDRLTLAYAEIDLSPGEMCTIRCPHGASAVLQVAALKSQKKVKTKGNDAPDMDQFTMFNIGQDIK